jgi:hypothetical protein
MCNKEGYKIKDEEIKNNEEKDIILNSNAITLDELRKIRLAYYDKKII